MDVIWGNGSLFFIEERCVEPGLALGKFDLEGDMVAVRVDLRRARAANPVVPVPDLSLLGRHL